MTRERKKSPPREAKHTAEPAQNREALQQQESSLRASLAEAKRQVKLYQDQLDRCIARQANLSAVSEA